MRVLSVVFSLVLSLGFLLTTALTAQAIETKPTTVSPTTPEQVKTHKEVARKQKILKEKLIQNAPPEEVHKAKGDVQKSRVKANEADYNAESAATPGQNSDQ